MRCNCENKNCGICYGHGCSNEAGDQRAMYVGRLCNSCADEMPEEYMIREDK